MNRTFSARIAPLSIAAVLLATSIAVPAHGTELVVNLQGIRAQTGLIKVAVVDTADAFDGKAAPVQTGGAPASGEDASFTFKTLEPGMYAVMVTHDENGNGKLDTNLLGMPVEGYGFSNNPQVMRKPTWDEVRFEIDDADISIDIVLR